MGIEALLNLTIHDICGKDSETYQASNVVGKQKLHCHRYETLGACVAVTPHLQVQNLDFYALHDLCVAEIENLDLKSCTIVNVLYNWCLRNVNVHVKYFLVKHANWHICS